MPRNSGGMPRRSMNYGGHRDKCQQLFLEFGNVEQLDFASIQFGFERIVNARLGWHCNLIRDPVLAEIGTKCLSGVSIAVDPGQSIRLERLRNISSSRPNSKRLPNPALLGRRAFRSAPTMRSSPLPTTTLPSSVRC